jgi:1,4-alpha-glucan branching enzyme
MAGTGADAARAGATAAAAGRKSRQSKPIQPAEGEEPSAAGADGDAPPPAKVTKPAKAAKPAKPLTAAESDKPAKAAKTAKTAKSAKTAKTAKTAAAATAAPKATVAAKRTAPAKPAAKKASAAKKSPAAKTAKTAKATGAAEAGGKARTTRSGPAAAPPAPPRPELAEHERRWLLDGGCHDPHALLGAHVLDGDAGLVVRVLRPFADAVTVVTADQRYPLDHSGDGLFTGVLPLPAIPDYRLEVVYGETVLRTDDPYRHLPTLGEVDLHLIGEGRHEQLWQVLGAHVRSFDGPLGGVTGTTFAVWAPNARGVRVSGDFNGWNSVGHPMRSLGSSGVWELFVPDVGAGTKYKFDVLGADGRWRQKADPMARSTELPPATASVVDDTDYRWGDADWLAQRAGVDAYQSPMSVYEVHLPSWRPGLGYRDLADELTAYLRDLEFTHVEFLPVTEYPFGGSWGYQVTSYFAPTSRLGSPADFRHLIDTLHQAGIGVIMDWVPAHFPRDEWALADFDGTALYEHANPLLGAHPEWGTLVFDFGRREVRNFLVASALYWCEEFHIDGLRVDAVASMLYLDYARENGDWQPNTFGGRENLEAVSFLQELNATVYKRVPGVVTIAEESTAWPGVSQPTHIPAGPNGMGGLGFGLKWNMGWMHDSLDYLAEAPINRSYHHDRLTFSMVYAFSEKYVLPISHDEVVHGKASLISKMPGDEWQQFANLRAYLAYMWAHPGKQLLFSGCEFAQRAEWSQERGLDWWELDYDTHRGVRDLVRDLNHAYRDRPALWQRDHSGDGFRWLLSDDRQHNLIAFARYGEDGRMLVCVCNFAGVPWERHEVPMPKAGMWRELVNTDAAEYGGSGVGNMGRVEALPGEYSGLPAHAMMRVPPLGALWLVPED